MAGSNLARAAKNAVSKFSKDNMVAYAGAIAFQAFLSIFPLIIFLLALLGFLGIPSFFDWILNQAQTALPQSAYDLVQRIVAQVRGQASGGLLSFGIIFALLSASSAVRMAMIALNVTYDVEDRTAWKKYALSVLYTLVLVVLVIVAVGLMLLGNQVIGWLAQQIGLGSLFVALWTWLRWPVAVVLLMVILAFVYYLFPNTTQPFKFITPGAVIAVIVWIIASFVFSYYLTNFATYSATYGALAGIIVLLLYLFISAATMLLGAEVNVEFYREVVEGRDEDDGGAEKQTG